MLGPNGVGKSTIFNLITGLKNPNHGEIIIEGINVTNLPINERFTKFKLGLVPQHGGLIHDLTLLNNLKLVSFSSNKRTSINSSRYNYSVDLSKCGIDPQKLHSLSRIIIPIENNYIFSLPILTLILIHPSINACELW